MKNTGSRAKVMHGNALRTTGGLTKENLKYNKNGKIVSVKASEITLQRINSPKLGGGQNQLMLYLYTLDGEEQILNPDTDKNYYNFYESISSGGPSFEFVSKNGSITKSDDVNLVRGKKLDNPVIVLKKNNEYYGVLSTNKKDANKILPKVKETFKSEQSWHERINAKNFDQVLGTNALDN